MQLDDQKKHCRDCRDGQQRYSQSIESHVDIEEIVNIEDVVCINCTHYNIINRDRRF